jgi:RNA 3'-terminal phosphate cyclase-like protein
VYKSKELICVFMRVDINFRGVTNDNMDISVDILRTVTIPLMKNFMPEAQVTFKVHKRGARPLGGGDVYFSIAPVKELSPVSMIKEGKFKRVRGVAFTMKCSNQIAMGIIDKAREVLNNLLPDVYIYTDHSRGKESGLSPGFGVSMAVQSTDGVMMSAEIASEGQSAR